MLLLLLPLLLLLLLLLLVLLLLLLLLLLLQGDTSGHRHYRLNVKSHTPRSETMAPNKMGGGGKG